MKMSSSDIPGIHFYHPSNIGKLLPGEEGFLYLKEMENQFTKPKRRQKTFAKFVRYLSL